MPAVATPIVTLPQAKTQLNIPGSDTSNDTELSTFVSVASQMIVNRIGAVAGSPTVSEWHDGGSTDILLYDEGPVQSITSVTESIGSQTYTLSQIVLDSGSSPTSFGYTVDLDLGLLVRRAAGMAVPFAPGEANIHVTFVGGYASVPADITQACLILIQHLWETQRGGTRRGPATIDSGTAYSMPNRVMEILWPYIVPGIA